MASWGCRRDGGRGGEGAGEVGGEGVEHVDIGRHKVECFLSQLASLSYFTFCLPIGAARHHFHRFLLVRHLPSSAVPLPLHAVPSHNWPLPVLFFLSCLPFLYLYLCSFWRSFSARLSCLLFGNFPGIHCDLTSPKIYPSQIHQTQPQPQPSLYFS